MCTVNFRDQISNIKCENEQGLQEFVKHINILLLNSELIAKIEEVSAIAKSEVDEEIDDLCQKIRSFVCELEAASNTCSKHALTK